MPRMVICPYAYYDEKPLVHLWNLTMTHDPINESVLQTRVLLDANFSSDGLLVAREAGELRGFVLSIMRQVPLLQGPEPDVGWITAFGVHPEYRRRGIGRQLFEATLARLASLGCKCVLISPYTPNYFIPGVDVDAYPEAMAFLGASGWEITSTPISMRADLTSFQIPQEIKELGWYLAREQGIIVDPVYSGRLPELKTFIAKNFGWEWFRFAQEYLLELFGPGSDQTCFLIATQGGERIVGYCQARRERFGPFGVAEDMRNRGIGRVLLFNCLLAMRTQGFHCAWFLWTGKEAARLYSLAGFKQVRQFAVMKKEL